MLKRVLALRSAGGRVNRAGSCSAISVRSPSLAPLTETVWTCISRAGSVHILKRDSNSPFEGCGSASPGQLCHSWTSASFSTTRQSRVCAVCRRPRRRLRVGKGFVLAAMSASGRPPPVSAPLQRVQLVRAESTCPRASCERGAARLLTSRLSAASLPWTGVRPAVSSWIRD